MPGGPFQRKQCAPFRLHYAPLTMFLAPYHGYRHINTVLQPASLPDIAQQINHLTDEFKENISDSHDISDHIHIVTPDYVIAKEERISTHFVTGAQSPLAARKNLSVHDVLDYPFILTEKRMGYRRVFDEALAKQSLDIQPILEIGRTDLITASLEKGVGISFLPDFVTHKKVAEGKLVYLNITDFEIDIWKQLIYHRNKWISNHFHAFIEYVKEKEFFEG